MRTLLIDLQPRRSLGQQAPHLLGLGLRQQQVVPPGRQQGRAADPRQVGRRIGFGEAQYGIGIGRRVLGGEGGQVSRIAVVARLRLEARSTAPGRIAAMPPARTAAALAESSARASPAVRGVGFDSTRAGTRPGWRAA
jgi:hypothetical protein